MLYRMSYHKDQSAILLLFTLVQRKNAIRRNLHNQIWIWQRILLGDPCAEDCFVTQFYKLWVCLLTLLNSKSWNPDLQRKREEQLHLITMFYNNSAPEAAHINVASLPSRHHLGSIENQYREKHRFTQNSIQLHPLWPQPWELHER